MNADNLVKMANQIGAFFEAMPDRAEALAGIATHVRRFWAPRMRTALQAHYDATGGAGLKAIVIDALVTHSILQRADGTTSPQKHAFDGASEA